jgi:hypothetical protein
VSVDKILLLMKSWEVRAGKLLKSIETGGKMQKQPETDIIQSFKIGSSQLTYCLFNERDVPLKYLNCSEFK